VAVERLSRRDQGAGVCRHCTVAKLRPRPLASLGENYGFSWFFMENRIDLKWICSDLYGSRPDANAKAAWLSSSFFIAPLIGVESREKETANSESTKNQSRA
jgi:hypothetical protein